MTWIRRGLVELPLPVRHAVIGAVVLGVCGVVVGTVVGLRTYAPTAWAAAVEVGLPAALVGAVSGLATGSLRRVAGRARRG